MYLPSYFREISRLGSIIAEMFNNLLRGMNHQVYKGYKVYEKQIPSNMWLSWHNIDSLVV
jgi:hypothetical protein